MDITKFYPSIDHNILKSIISRKIKDTKVLEILYEIIDSVNGINGIYGKGVPIGNYLSQYFAKKYMRHSMNDGEHFTESEAMDLVSDMYHTEGGRKYSGEKFDIHKAKEICERYRGVIPVSATPTDVYVAINSQYHDYVELFKSWFGDNVDQKIIESAIIFWFKDVDCKSRNKVVSYFKEY